MFQRTAMLPLQCPTLGLWHPSEVDDSLTSLQWLLQDFVVGANSGGPQPGGGPGRETLLSGHRHQPPPPPSVPVALPTDMASVGIPPTLVLPTPVVVTYGHCPGGVDAGEKPTQSCSTLLFMAIQGSERGKLTLSAVYEWFTVNFSYYRCAASATWKDTIRHTLSVNKGFIKLPKEKGESGKGRFWTVDPQHVDHFRCNVDKVQIDLRSGSQQLPGHSDEVTCAERNLPSQAVSGRKRKRLQQASPTSLAKVTRHSTRSSSQLLRGDEQKELESVKEHFDLGPLVEWASSKEPSADSGEPLSALSPTHPPVQYQLMELCNVDSPAVSVPPSPPSCALDWLPQSQCTIPTLDDLADFDWDAFLVAVSSEELSQDSGEPLSSVPTEEDQMVNFNPMFCLCSLFPGELNPDSEELLSLIF